MVATVKRRAELLVDQLRSRAKRAPFATSVQGQVLIKGVDIDQTLVIAEHELKRGRFASVLTLWGIRDQVYTEAQAQRVSYLFPIRRHPEGLLRRLALHLGNLEHLSKRKRRGPGRARAGLPGREEASQGRGRVGRRPREQGHSDGRHPSPCPALRPDPRRGSWNSALSAVLGGLQAFPDPAFSRPGLI